jgi:hypothetical protein
VGVMSFSHAAYFARQVDNCISICCRLSTEEVILARFGTFASRYIYNMMYGRQERIFFLLPRTWEMILKQLKRNTNIFTTVETWRRKDCCFLVLKLRRKMYMKN